MKIIVNMGVAMAVTAVTAFSQSLTSAIPI